MSMVLANRIKSKREAERLSLRQVADILGCDTAQVYRWEQGLAEPSSQFWPKIQEWISIANSQRFIANLQRPASSQHPSKDAWFMVAESIVAGCAIVHGGRCECPLLNPCTRLWDSLTEKCSDKLLTPRDLLEFIFKFSDLQDQLEKAK